MTDPDGEWDFSPTSEPTSPEDESGTSPPLEAEAEDQVQSGPVEDEVLIVALAAGQTQVQAAATAGVSDRTVRRRLQDPGFRARLHAAEAKRAAEERARIRASADRGWDVIDELMEPGVKPTVRLQAAKIALGTAERASVAEIEQRLGRLEAHREEPEPWISD